MSVASPRTCISWNTVLTNDSHGSFVATYWYDGNWKGAIRVFDLNLKLAWEKAGLPSGKKHTLTYADGKLVIGSGDGWVTYARGDWKYIAAYAIQTGVVLWKCDLSTFNYQCIENVPYFNGCFYAQTDEDHTKYPSSKVFRINAADGKLEEVFDYGKTITACAPCIIADGKLFKGGLWQDRLVVVQIAEGSKLAWPGPFGDPQTNQMAARDLAAKMVPMREVGQKPSPETSHKKKTLAPAAGPRHSLVENGRAVARIVLPAKPDPLESYAADELQKFVRLITGRDLPIVNERQKPEDVVINWNEPPSPPGYGVWLGQTKASASAGFTLTEAALGRDGYAAQADGNGLIVVGRCPLGTLFGVYDIIEQEFGVRWFVPNEYRTTRYKGDTGTLVWFQDPIGDVVPKADTIAVGTFRREFKPSFEYRWVCEGDWALRNRMNLWAPVNGQTVGVNWKWDFHTFGELIPPDKYFKTHPDWFALVKGKRQGITDPHGHSSQLCTSNPEVIDKLAQGLIETIQADPTIEVISLTPNDGGGFCECKQCEALDGPPRDGFKRPAGQQTQPWSYSNRFAIMNNEVARRAAKHFPKVKIKVGAYAYYLLPPDIKDFRLEPNLLVQICRFSPSRSIVEQWAALTDQLGVYQYYTLANFGRHQLLRPLVHEMRSDIPWLRDRGVKGFYTQYMQQPWYQCPLNHYIAAKLAWNADLDVDWLISDYCDKFFEKASRPMARVLAGNRAGHAAVRETRRPGPCGRRTRVRSCYSRQTAFALGQSPANGKYGGGAAARGCDSRWVRRLRASALGLPQLKP